MKNNTQLINNIIGQLKGIDRMMNEKEGYDKVIIQLKAVKSALNSMTNKYIKESFETCVTGKDSEEICKRFFAEIIENE